jgi:hypothetical protein
MFCIYVKFVTFVGFNPLIIMSEKGYFLEVTTLDNRLVCAFSDNSLRETVRLASLYVANMDNYAKVYRELRAMEGAFVGIFFRTDDPEIKPIQGKGLTKHLIVKIHAFNLDWSLGPHGDKTWGSRPAALPSA